MTRLALIIGLSAATLAATVHGAKADEAGCTALAQSGRFANTAVASATVVPAAARTPAFAK
jgi:hypothetical protein